MAKSSQQRFRARLYKLYGQCAISGLDDRRFLVASHIKPREDCENSEEEFDEANGFLLLPHFDHLFDVGFISFEDDGSILISDHLPKPMAALYGIYPATRIVIKREETKIYLKWHREKVYEEKFKKL